MDTKRSDIRMLALSALFTALIAAGAFLRVPLPLLPFTLQTLFTTLAALLLGPRYGTLACAAYMVLGLLGLPIFTAGGGPQYIFHPTFGYIIGFAAGALLAGTLIQRSTRRGFSVYVLAGLADIAVVYAIGLVWFWAVRAFYLQDPIGVWPLLLACFVPTIGIDIVKVLLASVLAVRLEPVLRLYHTGSQNA